MKFDTRTRRVSGRFGCPSNFVNWFLSGGFRFLLGVFCFFKVSSFFQGFLGSFGVFFVSFRFRVFSEVFRFLSGFEIFFEFRVHPRVKNKTHTQT
jgi:hypothetical protein